MAALASSPHGKKSAAERAALEIANRIVMSVLSAGADVRRGRGRRRNQRLRHSVMRHFLIAFLAPPVSVPSLPSRVQAARSRLPPVPRPRLPHSLATARGPAVLAKPLPPITGKANSNLSTASSADEKPVRFRRQTAPSPPLSGLGARAVVNVASSDGNRSSRRPRVSTSGPSLFPAGAPSTPVPSTWPSSSPVNGEPRPTPSGDLHRLCADRGARSRRGAHGIRRCFERRGSGGFGGDAGTSDSPACTTAPRAEVAAAGAGSCRRVSSTEREHADNELTVTRGSERPASLDMGIGRVVQGTGACPGRTHLCFGGSFSMTPPATFSSQPVTT
jgi:hypothetical protein